MKHGSSNRRQRGRSGSNRRGGQGGGNNRSRVFDSNGPEVRIRGTAHQVVEKYEALAKDAASAGDRVLAESYLQHAEHYVRIIASWDDDVPMQQDSVAREESKPAEVTGNKAELSEDDDLSLPTSILGDVPKVEAVEKSEPVTA